MSMHGDESDVTIKITVPYAIAAATREEKDRWGVNQELTHRIEYLLFVEGAYNKRYPPPPKKNGGQTQQQSTSPPFPQPKAYPRPQMGGRRQITGDDPGTIYAIKKPDRCCCCAKALPIGTMVIFRTNGEGERECWDLEHWNEALERQRGTI